MKMNRLALLLVLAVVSCTPTESPIKLDNTFPPNCNQTSAPQVSQGGGSLDIAATLSYLILVEVTSDLEFPTPPTSPEANDFIANTIALSYTATLQPSTNLAIKPDKEAFYFVIPAQAGVPGVQTAQGNAEPWIVLNMIGTNAANTLSNSMSVGDVVDLNVDLTLQGYLRGGGNMTSTAVNYPITVVKSNFSCGTAKEALTGPCGTVGGQDAYPALCCGQADAGC